MGSVFYFDFNPLISRRERQWRPFMPSTAAHGLGRGDGFPGGDSRVTHNHPLWRWGGVGAHRRRCPPSVRHAPQPHRSSEQKQLPVENCPLGLKTGPEARSADEAPWGRGRKLRDDPQRRTSWLRGGASLGWCRERPPGGAGPRGGRLGSSARGGRAAGQTPAGFSCSVVGPEGCRRQAWPEVGEASPLLLLQPSPAPREPSLG